VRLTTPTRGRIGPYEARLAPVDVEGRVVALWQVHDLDAHVDRAALLAAERAPEPPYWAHLRSGARVLAAAVPDDAGRVVEIGCGLGLPGLVAALRGASVVFVDHEPVPLAFVAASARANGLAATHCVIADFTEPPFRDAFDLVLAAEIVYDRAGFTSLARSLAALAGARGRVLLTDGQRIDTRGFYAALETAGLRWRADTLRVAEEGFPVEVRLVEAWRRR
jgi:predicted nicotinamide N-methyase